MAVLLSRGPLRTVAIQSSCSIPAPGHPAVPPPGDSGLCELAGTARVASYRDIQYGVRCPVQCRITGELSNLLRSGSGYSSSSSE